jgi:hypothetical protein
LKIKGHASQKKNGNIKKNRPLKGKRALLDKSQRLQGIMPVDEGYGSMKNTRKKDHMERKIAVFVANMTWIMFSPQRRW